MSVLRFPQGLPQTSVSFLILGAALYLFSWSDTLYAQVGRGGMMETMGFQQPSAPTIGKPRIIKAVATDQCLIESQASFPNVTGGTPDQSKILGSALNTLEVRGAIGAAAVIRRSKVSVEPAVLGSDGRILGGKQVPGGIRLTSSAVSNAPGRKGFAAALATHEWGHLIGNSQAKGILISGGAGTVYQSYNSTVRTKCLVSHYCSSGHSSGKRNEEFAEVFAAFVYTPELLRNSCPLAYEFMAKNVFGKAPDLNNCKAGKASYVYQVADGRNVPVNSPSDAPAGSPAMMDIGGIFLPLLMFMQEDDQSAPGPEDDKPPVGSGTFPASRGGTATPVTPEVDPPPVINQGPQMEHQ